MIFTTNEFYAVEATRDAIPEIQRFYELCHEYTRLAVGKAVSPDEAQRGFDVHPPGEMCIGTTRHQWLMVRNQTTHDIIASIALDINLLAQGIWHIGFFMIASHLWGTGKGQAVYDALERWMLQGGAQWLRLGVVQQNARGKRFWERNGYTSVRVRHGIEMGALRNTVFTMIKPISPQTIESYFDVQSRDTREHFAALA